MPANNPHSRTLLGSLRSGCEMDSDSGLHRAKRAAVVASLVAYIREITASVISRAELRLARDDLNEMLDFLEELDHGNDESADVEESVDNDAQQAASAASDNLDDEQLLAEPNKTRDLVEGQASEDSVADTAEAYRSSSSDNQLRQLRAVAEQARAEAVRQGIVNSKYAIKDDDVWRSLHLLALRLPSDKAQHFRDEAAKAVGMPTRGSEKFARLLIPEFEGTQEVNLGSTDAGSVVGKNRCRVQSAVSANSEAWQPHGPLLEALVNVLVLLDLEDENLRILSGHVGSNLTEPPSKISDAFKDYVDLHLGRVGTDSGQTELQLLEVLRDTLAVVPAQVPHHQSWWAANAGHAIDHMVAVLANKSRKCGRPPDSANKNLVDNGAVHSVSKPIWSDSSGLLWTLSPYIELDNGTVIKGWGVYAK